MKTIEELKAQSKMVLKDKVKVKKTKFNSTQADIQAQDSWKRNKVKVKKTKSKVKEDLKELIKPKVKGDVQIIVPKLKLNIIKVKIVGTTPLLMDKFPDKVRKEILQKQSGLTKGKKQLRDIDSEFLNAIHFIEDDKIGFPAQAFKSAMIESTSFVGSRDFSKKLLKGIQIINSEGNDLIPISYEGKISKLTHYPKDSNTKISPMFNKWGCELIIQYDSNNISPQDLISLLNYSGFYYGIGIWSPRAKCGGKYGMYEVEVPKGSK